MELAEKESRINFISRPFGRYYLHHYHSEKSNAMIFIMIKLVGAEVVKQSDGTTLSKYIFKTSKGNHLHLEWGEFMELDDQKDAEDKWLDEAKRVLLK